MMALGQAKKQQTTKDRVVIFDHEQKTCEIIPVEERNEERIVAGDKSIPLADLDLTLSKQGRVYVLNAPTQYIQSAENLARVEKNTIIRQIAQYHKREDESPRTNWLQIALIGLMGIITIVAIAGGGGN